MTSNTIHPDKLFNFKHLALLRPVIFPKAFFASAIVLCLCGCGGNFDDYDDKAFDFPEQAAPPVPNPIPYEPPEQPEPAPVAPAAEEKADASVPTPPEDAGTPPVPAKPAKKAPAKKTSDVQEIRVKGSNTSDSSSSYEPPPPPPPPPETSNTDVQPRGSDELDETSEGPGKASPKMKAPRKNMGKLPPRRRAPFGDPHYLESVGTDGDPRVAPRRQDLRPMREAGEHGRGMRRSSLSRAKDGD